MRIRTTVAAAALLPLALSTVAAHVPDGCYLADAGADAESTDDDVIACTLQTYLVEGETKVSNLSDVGLQAPITWDETAPDASVADGAGGGAFGSGPLRNLGDNTASGLKFEGTFTGPIDVMEFDLHAIAPTSLAYVLDDLGVSVTIDGVEIINTGTQLVVAPARPAPDSALPAGTVQFDFALTNIVDFMQLARLDTSADAEHTVEVIVQPWFSDSGSWAWVFDTTEVPSGVIFNPVVISEGASVHPVV